MPLLYPLPCNHGKDARRKNDEIIEKVEPNRQPPIGDDRHERDAMVIVDQLFIFVFKLAQLSKCPYGGLT